jgi:micrococcal nuclease
MGAAAVCVLLILVGPADACQANRIDEEAQVASVYDGDTVWLADGRKLRLIGLDTPELGHDGTAPEPFAQQAADALSVLLARHRYRVLMRYDIERRDDYGRWLAHLYLPDGTSITAHMLRAGLATHLTVPPDTYDLDCYRRAEAQARAADTGIWHLPGYRIVASSDIDPDARGFVRVRGRIVRVGHSRGSVWLDMEGDIALRVDREDTENFPRFDFDVLSGKQVVARGWLYEHDGELRMQIRHPAALEVGR